MNRIPLAVIVLVIAVVLGATAGHLVWGDMILWGTMSDGDQILWGTLGDSGEYVVWGT